MKRMLMLLLALLLLTGCAGADSQVVPDYVLTYAENQPAGYPTVLGAQYFADLVRERTEGKVVIQVKCGGEFGTEAEVLEQMSFGGIDFARVSLAELSDELPILNVLQLPFLYEDAGHMWRILDGELGTDFLGQVSELGLVGLSWYDGGARCFYTDVRPIRTPADLQGLTVRVQDSQMAADMVQLLGAKPVILDYDAVFSSFKLGKIDAAENNLSAYEASGHWQVAGYFTADEHTRVPELQLASAFVWETLPQEYRQVIAECARESALYQRELWQTHQQQARTRIQNAGCLEILLTPDERETFRQTVLPLYERYCADYMDLVAQIQNG